MQLLASNGADAYEAGHALVEQAPVVNGYSWFGDAVQAVPGENS